MFAAGWATPSGPSPVGLAPLRASEQVDVGESARLLVAADADDGVASLAVCRHPVGHRLGQGSQHRVHDPEAGNTAGAAGRRQHGVDYGGDRRTHFDEAGVPGRVGDAGVHQEPQRAVDRCLGEGDRRVDPGLHLARRTLEVDHDAVAVDGYGDLEHQRAVGHVVGVDVAGCVVGAVRQGLDLLPRQVLGVVDQHIHVAAHRGRAVAVGEAHQAPLARPGRGDLRSEVAQHLVGHAHVGGEDREDGLDGLAPVVEPESRDAQPLLVYLGGVGRVRPRDDASHVRMVRDDAGEALGLAVDEHGLNYVDVGQVYAAGGVGVVQDEHVTLGHRVAVLDDDRRDGGREGAEMADDGEALGDDLARYGRRRRWSSPWRP